MISGRQRRIALTAAASCALFGLGGCGQKGPLYLPDPKPQAVPATAPAATPADDEETRRKLPPNPAPATAR